MQDHGGHVFPVSVHVPQPHVLRVRAVGVAPGDDDALGLPAVRASEGWGGGRVGPKYSYTMKKGGSSLSTSFGVFYFPWLKDVES